MASLRDKLAERIPAVKAEIEKVVRDHGDKKISDVTVAQAYGGMRGVKCMVCDTSVVQPDTGLILRGIPLSEVSDRKPEEIFWLLLTGELPSAGDLAEFEKDLAARSEVPQYVIDTLRLQPKTSHPMAMLGIGLLGTCCG